MSTGSTPVWSAPHNGLIGDASATAGAGQINQFLGTHAIQVVYQGGSILTPNGSGASAFAIPLVNVDVDQPFTMSGTVIGRVQVPVLPVGAGADMLVSLCTDNAGAPGTVVTQTRVPAAWIYQLAAVSGSGPASQPTATQLTGNPLAVAQFNNLSVGTPSFNALQIPAVQQASNAVNPTPVSFGNYVIIIGGQNGTDTAYFPNVFTYYCDASGNVSPPVAQPNFPTAIFEMGAAAGLEATSGSVDVVVIGGGTSPSSGGTTGVYTSTLNTATGTLSAWTNQAAYPLAVTGPGVAIVGDYVYGLTGQTGSGTYTPNVYFAQIQNGQISVWTATTPLPVSMVGPAVTVLGSFLIVSGAIAATATPVTYFAAINADGSLGTWISTLAVAGDYGALAEPQVIPFGEFGFATNGVSSIAQVSFNPSSGPGISAYVTNLPALSNGAWATAVDAGAGQWQFFNLNAGTAVDFEYLAALVSLTPMISVPLPASGLTNGATYHVLLRQQGGDLNDFLRVSTDVNVFPGNPTMSTSARGAYAWSAGASGHAVPLHIFDGAPPPTVMPAMPMHLWEDQGAKITTLVTATTPDQRLLGILEATRQAVALNANQGFESGIAPWTVSGGTVVQSTAQAYTGTYSAQVTPSGSAANVFIGSENIPCMPGQAVTATGWIWLTAAVVGNVSMSINWYTLGGAYISTSSNDVSVGATTWTQLSNAFTAPATAYSFSIAPTVSGTPAASNVFYVDTVHAHYAYTGPQNSTVTQVMWSGAWPNPWPSVGAMQLA